MNRDQMRGASRHLKGRAQTTIGGLAGDPVRQARGAVNQVAGGAQYAYGRARDRAEDLVDDGRHLAHAARERADDLIEDGRHYAGKPAAGPGPTAGRQSGTPTPIAPPRSSPSSASRSRWAGSLLVLNPLNPGDPDDPQASHRLPVAEGDRLRLAPGDRPRGDAPAPGLLSGPGRG